MAGELAAAFGGVGALAVVSRLTRSTTLSAITGAIGLLLALGAVHVVRSVFRWQADLWVVPYLTQNREKFDRTRPIDVCFYFVDHYEPDWADAPVDLQIERVRKWEAAYRDAVAGHVDSDGRCPQHTWFSPVAGIHPAAMSVIATWPGLQWGEIEYHLHHDPKMNEAEIAAQIRQDIEALQRYHAVPTRRYGFVHGMSALGAGDPEYCQAKGEIDVLLETGCYADFTFGAVDSPAQPRQVNSIYYASANGKPKSYDTGPQAEVAKSHPGLLLIPGPMWLGLARRALDDGDLSQSSPPTPRRIARWLDAHIHVKGRPNWVLIGVHSHSAVEGNRDELFCGGMQKLWQALESRFKTAKARLHYCTAREVYNIVKAGEAGLTGDPNDYRDYEIPRPTAAQQCAQVGGGNSIT